jgi:hypothetical protein
MGRGLVATAMRLAIWVPLLVWRGKKIEAIIKPFKPSR